MTYLLGESLLIELWLVIVILPFFSVRKKFNRTATNCGHEKLLGACHQVGFRLSAANWETRKNASISLLYFI